MHKNCVTFHLISLFFLVHADHSLFLSLFWSSTQDISSFTSHDSQKLQVLESRNIYERLYEKYINESWEQCWGLQTMMQVDGGLGVWGSSVKCYGHHFANIVSTCYKLNRSLDHPSHIHYQEYIQRLRVLIHDHEIWWSMLTFA